MPKGEAAVMAGAGCGLGKTGAEQDLILNLKAAGLSETSIREFLVCWKAGKTTEQLRLLSQNRAKLLDKVHREEKKIGCLDYLVYQIEKGKTY